MTDNRLIDEKSEHKYKKHPRISLRDYFAAHCPDNILNDTSCREADERLIGEPYPYNRQGIPTPEERMACIMWGLKVTTRRRYMYADAMLQSWGEQGR